MSGRSDRVPHDGHPCGRRDPRDRLRVTAYLWRMTSPQPQPVMPRPRSTPWRAIGFGLLLHVLAPTDAAAQASDDAAKRELATEVLRLTRAGEAIVQMLEQTLPMQRISSPQVPGEFWDSLLVRARKDVDSLTRLLAPAFSDAFTLDELRQLVAFYRSPLGKRLVEEQPGIVVRSTEIGQQWGMRIGMEVGEQLMRAGRMRPPDS